MELKNQKEGKVNVWRHPDQKFIDCENCGRKNINLRIHNYCPICAELIWRSRIVVSVHGELPFDVERFEQPELLLGEEIKE